MYLASPGTSFIDPVARAPQPVSAPTPIYVLQPVTSAPAPTGTSQFQVLDTGAPTTGAGGNTSGAKINFNTSTPDQTIEIPLISPQAASATGDNAPSFDWKILALIAAAVALALILMKKER